MILFIELTLWYRSFAGIKKLLRGGGVKINKGIDDIPLLKRNMRIFLTKFFTDVKVIEKENVSMILTMS